MRPPTRGPARLAAAAALLFLLASGISRPQPAPAQNNPDITDLMGVFEKAYIKLMESVILLPIQEIGGDMPYDAIEKSAGQISETAKLLPKLDDYRREEDFAALARQVQELSDRLSAAAKEKKFGAAADAFIRLRLACLRCHAEFRF